MQELKHVLALPMSCLALLILGTQVLSQELPKGVTPEDLAKNNKLFIELATKAFQWAP